MAYNMDRWRELLPDGWRPSWLPQMPFTDYHQLNLDWIIETVKEWTGRLVDFFDEDGAKDLVEEVLEEHPEWTTTVQDGTITKSKIDTSFLPEIENAYVTPEMFGAVGDGVTDDKDAIDAMIAYAHTNGINLILLKSDILTSKSISLYSNMIFDGCGHSVNFAFAQNTYYRGFTNKHGKYYKYNISDNGYYDETGTDPDENITIRNVTIKGSRIVKDGDYKPRGHFAFEHVNGVKIINCKSSFECECNAWFARANNVLVDRCEFIIPFLQDAGSGGNLWFNTSYENGDTANYGNYTITNNYFSSFIDEAISLKADGASTFSTFNINNNIFKSYNGQAVSLKPNSGALYDVDGSIKHNNFAMGAITLYPFLKNLVIESNYFGREISPLRAPNIRDGVFVNQTGDGSLLTELVIKNNVFDNTDETSFVWLSLQYIQKYTIEGNIFGNAQNHIYITNSGTQCEKTIKNNKFRNAALSIHTVSNAYSTIEGNQFYNTTTAIGSGGNGLDKMTIKDNIFDTVTDAILYNTGYLRNLVIVSNYFKSVTNAIRLPDGGNYAALWNNKALVKDNILLSTTNLITDESSGHTNDFTLVNNYKNNMDTGSAWNQAT